MKIFLIAFLISTAALADRVSYLSSASASFDKMDRKSIEDLYETVSVLERNKCRSLMTGITLKCLETEVMRYCKNDQCLKAADIIIVNRLNEKLFISNAEKVKIAEKKSNYSTAVGQAILRKYALLASDFFIYAKDDSPQSIDSFCLKKSDEKKLPWQACVSALVWFKSVSR